MNRLEDAEKTIMFIYGLRIENDLSTPTAMDYATWRKELAREYLERHGLLTDELKQKCDRGM